jgi:hypothetical protein
MSPGWFSEVAQVAVTSIQSANKRYEQLSFPTRTESVSWYSLHQWSGLTWNKYLVALARNASVYARAAAAETIENMSQLDEDWDGYGAAKISSEARGNAMRVLNTLPATLSTPDIVPNPNGTIAFEWETDKAVAHLEIGKTKFSLYVKPVNGNPALADGAARYFDPTLGATIEALLYPSDTNSAITVVNYAGDHGRHAR